MTIQEIIEMKRKMAPIMIGIPKMVWVIIKNMFSKVRKFLSRNRVFFEIGFTFALALFTYFLYRVTSEYTSFTRTIMAINQEQLASARVEQIQITIEPSFLAGTKIKKDGHLILSLRNLSPVVDFTVKEVYIIGDIYEKGEIIEKGIKLVEKKIDIELPRTMAERLDVLDQLIYNLKGRRIIGEKLDLAGKILKNLQCKIYYVSKITGTPYFSSNIEFEAK